MLSRCHNHNRFVNWKEISLKPMQQKAFIGEFLYYRSEKENGVMPQNTQCKMLNIYQLKSHCTIVMI